MKTTNYLGWGNTVPRKKGWTRIIGLTGFLILISGAMASAKNSDPKIIVNNKSKEALNVDFQVRTITGKVVDENGEPIPGASISIKGTANGTLSDSNGNYTLPNVPDGTTLVYSFIGTKTQEIVISGRTSINVTLVSNNISLEETVVIGYGSVKKSNLTGAVSKITSEAIQDRPLVNVGEALQGQVAGVRIQSNSGRPGNEPTIRIRGVNSINGNSSPLYVIDGVPRDNMSDINPQDISSITILKDAASTSIYGARGGNGVVLIETKNGKGKPSISFDASYGISRAEKLLDRMNGPEYVAWNIYRRNVNHLRAGGSMSDPMSSRLIGDQIPDEFFNKPATDWQRALLQDAPIQNYSFSASAKGDIGSIYFSAGHLGQEGILVFTGDKRDNARLNTTLNVAENLHAGLNIAVSINKQFGEDGNGKDKSFQQALQQSPLVNLSEATVAWGFPTNLGAAYPNPYERLKHLIQDQNDTRIATSLWAEYHVIKGLTLRSQYGYNYDNGASKFFVSANEGYNTVTRGSAGATNLNSWTLQNTLTYDKSIKNHNFDILLGQTEEQQKAYNLSTASSGYPYDNIPTLNVAPTPTSSTSSNSTYSNASFFGRLTYNFKDRYLFSASTRYEGSSRFGPNKKYGLFSAFSAGWKINEEDFMKNVSWISLLKPRISYGESGNDRIGDYRFVGLLGVTAASFGGTLAPGIAPSNIANPNLKWEATKSLDLALDFNVLKDRIQFTFDYYKNKTNDLLFNVTVPYSTGFGSYLTNLGAVQNKGWDTELTTVNTTGKFNWSTSLILSGNKNKVLDMGAVNTIITNASFEASYITQVGSPISQFYGLKTNGVLLPSDFDATGKALVATQNGQIEGNQKFIDQNGDGKINSDDYVVLGNNFPDLIYGVTNRFAYKNFDLSFLIQGQVGGEILFQGSRSFDNGSANGGMQTRWLRSYKPDWTAIYPGKGDPIPYDYLKANHIDFSWDGKTPNPVGSNNSNSDDRIYSTTFVRIKNIALGYTLPNNILKNKLLSGFHAYLSIDNVKTFSDYPFYTPESNSFGNDTDRAGVDYITYPTSRRAVLGFTANF